MVLVIEVLGEDRQVNGQLQSVQYPGEGNGNPLQYSWLENPMNRGAWHATVMMLQRVGHNCGTEYAHTHVHTYM